MKQDFLINQTGQHYVEELPADTAIVRESDDMAQSTMARIEEMKYKALLQGHIVTMRPQDLANVFKAPVLPDHPPGEKIKLSTLLEASKLRREHRNKN